MKVKKTALITLFLVMLFSMSLSIFGAEPSLKLVKHSGNSYTFSMKCPGIKKSYMVNQKKTKKNYLEYSWGFEFTDGNNSYTVRTMHFKNDNKPTKMKVTEMQSNVWKRKGNSRTTISKAKLKMSGSTLTWTFDVPKDFKKSKFKVTTLGTCVSGAYYSKNVSMKIK